MVIFAAMAAKAIDLGPSAWAVRSSSGMNGARLVEAADPTATKLVALFDSVPAVPNRFRLQRRFGCFRSDHA